MQRGYGNQGNRLAPQRDDMDMRQTLEEKRRRARQEAMMKRMSPSGGSY